MASPLKRPWGVLESLREKDLDVRLNLLSVFELTDTDGSGSISREECVAMAQNLGYTLTDAGVSAFIEFARGHSTAHNEDKILFRDFASAVLSLSGSSLDIEERSQRLFGYFDVDGGGSITVDEMEQRLGFMGLDTAGTEQLFVDITGRPQKTVSTSEFTSYLRKTGF
mmetsp:Transcript_51961/g.103411  ORF Transcript_51961/g.103411 Transcript_51961/m.103411 type:complete len:168 (-) Transcript_51961:364-867(-)